MTEINYTPANRKRTMLTVLILSFITVGIYAQNTLNPDKQFSLWFGIRDYKQPPTETSAEPDFFDYYMDTDWENDTYRNIEEYLGMGYLRKWNQKFEIQFFCTETIQNDSAQFIVNVELSNNITLSAFTPIVYLVAPKYN